MSERKEFDTEKLADLLAKVQAATGPDGSVDSGLWWLSQGLTSIGGYRAQKADGTIVQVSYNWPEYSASIDASLALVEKMLPGWFWEANSCALHDAEDDDRFRAGLHTDEHHVIAYGYTAPLAILAALLSALSSIKEVGK